MVPFASVKLPFSVNLSVSLVSIVHYGFVRWAYQSLLFCHLSINSCVSSIFLSKKWMGHCQMTIVLSPNPNQRTLQLLDLDIPCTDFNEFCKS
jgi:hypothetical protein